MCQDSPDILFYWFRQAFGNHLVGFRVLTAVRAFLLYCPWAIAGKRKQRTQ